jgi:hypothetical protein
MGHVALATLAIVFVEGIEEGTVGQNTWPNHTGRLYNKPMKKSTKAEAKGLRPNGKEDLEAYRGSLAIENMLCECNMV